MSKKTAATIEGLLNNNVDPNSVKWYNEKVFDGQEHHALQGSTGNYSEEKDRECSSTSNVLDTSRVLHSNQYVTVKILWT
jgi:hypothetical protein